MIIFQNVTCSASTWRVGKFSLDGGSTYVNTSSYFSYSASGTTTNTDTDAYVHATASASARSGILFVKGTNVDGAPKEFECARNDGIGVFGDKGTNTLGPITHVKAYPIGGTFNGGQVYISAR
jgi:hypothetical protein